MQPLVQKVEVPSPPTEDVVSLFAPAMVDELNPGYLQGCLAPTHHATFVDDNLMAEVHHRIRHSIQKSSDSCCLLFGCPKQRYTPSLSEEKIVPAAAWPSEGSEAPAAAQPL